MTILRLTAVLPVAAGLLVACTSAERQCGAQSASPGMTPASGMASEQVRAQILGETARQFLEELESSNDVRGEIVGCIQVVTRPSLSGRCIPDVVQKIMLSFGQWEEKTRFTMIWIGFP